MTSPSPPTTRMNEFVSIDPLHELDTFLTDKLKLELPKDDVKKHQTLREIYQKCVSLHQSSISRKGKALENAIAHILERENIPFLAQACVDKDGNIIPGKVGHHRHDFVVKGVMGENIKDKIIISCKTSLRERFLQDANVCCKKLFMITYDPHAEAKKETLKEQHNIEIVTIKEDDTSAVQSMIKYIRKCDRKSKAIVKDECIGNDFGL